MRAALAIVGRLGVRAAPAIVGRVGVVCFSVLGTVIRCLYFANYSLILRSSCILPISNVKGRCREKKILQISLIFVWKIIETFYIFAV